MIAVIDYGVGNLRSVEKSLEYVGAEVCITSQSDDIMNADKIVFPGVGAIKPALDKLSHLNLMDPILRAMESGKPFLSICVGFQILFQTSEEGGEVKGLGVLKGRVQKFSSLKVPQIGWNKIKIENKNCPLFLDVEDGSYVYFCHSYYVQDIEADNIATSTAYGCRYTSSVWKDNIYGVQFHPEKSQTVGLKILDNFVNKV